MDEDVSTPAPSCAGYPPAGLNAARAPNAGIPLTTSPQSNRSENNRSWTTRIIHLALLLVVLHQLIGSEFMEMPLPGDTPEWPFLLHQYAGLGGVAAISAFWVWILVRHGETRLGRLLPWFSAVRMRDVVADLIDQVLHRLLGFGRMDDRGDALASAVHGLGLLTVTGMCLTGATYFFAKGTILGRDALMMHRLVANLMWAYLIGHAGMAVLHQFLGDHILSRMFWIKRRHP
jgi:cytochrome b561